jgi:hypothetical protein
VIKDAPWISLSEAGRRIGTSHTVVRRLVDRGALSLLELPGSHPRVATIEVESLVQKCTRSAGSTTSENA